MADDGGTIWEAPGPGLWAFDPPHFPTPVTGFVANTGLPGATEGFAAGFARYGNATLTVDRAVVNGWLFSRREAIGPELFDERERAATEALEKRLWRLDGERWFEVGRPAMIAACRDVQAVDPSSLDDVALGRHLLDTLEVQRRAQLHHFSHIAMVFVVGEWLLAAERWGIGADDAFALLAGSSPATSSAPHALGRIADALRAAGVTDVGSLDDVRAAGPEAAAALEEYLETYGWRTVGGFDLDALTLIEMPDAVVTSVRAALRAPYQPPRPDVDRVRAAVPDDERDVFDDLLAEARYVYGIRDDDVGPCMWARGLARRALLEIASRLVARGALAETDHVLEAGADELVALLRGEPGPDRSELAARADLRCARAQQQPPRTLGHPPERGAELPPAVARVSRAFAVYLSYMAGGDAVPEADGCVAGVGIGDRVYVGRATVAARVEEAFANLQPGDVLVTPITTPAFNSVLSIAGAVVVEFGGRTSHSAIMARELDIPAVVNAGGCMELIPDGAQVEVDPIRGTVRVVG